MKIWKQRFFQTIESKMINIMASGAGVMLLLNAARVEALLPPHWAPYFFTVSVLITALSGWAVKYKQSH